DLREAYEGFRHSHASIMHNVVTMLPTVSRIVQVEIRDLSEAEFDMIAGSKGRIRTHFDADLSRRRFEGEPWARQVERIGEGVPMLVYIAVAIALPAPN